jgi:glycogen synthase
MPDIQPKIIILTWEYGPIYVGGLGILVESLANELIAQGKDIEVLIPHSIKGFELPPYVTSMHTKTQKYYNQKYIVPELGLIRNFKENKKNAKIWPQLFSNPASKQKVSNQELLYPPVKLPGLVQSYAKSACEYLMKYPEDQPLQILAMDWLSVPTMKLLKTHRPQYKQVFYVNSTEYDRAPNKINKKVKHVEDVGFEIADLVGVVSEITKTSIVEEFGIKPEKIHVVFNDLEFNPDVLPHHQIESGKNVLFVGRLTQQKGLDFLIDAATHLVKIDNQIKFLIAGDGELTPDLIEKVAEKELEKNIIFTGYLNAAEKKILYRSTDIFVMPSPSEPFGLTALEAIKSGKPVIASEKSGFVGVVPSTPTFKYYDSSKFMEMLLFYISNPHEREILVRQQQEDLKQHSWHKQVSYFTETLDNLV